MLVVHIGYHKTGSSAVQEFCNSNRDILASHGLLYPEPMCPFPSHAELAWCFLQGLAPWRDRDYSVHEVYAYYDELIARNEAEGLNTIVSNEDISLIAERRHLFDAFVDRISRHNPTILVYVRDPIDYIMSTYHHAIINHATRLPFERWLGIEFSIDAINFRGRTERWERAFGPGSILVREYRAGESISDLLSLFSIDYPAASEPAINVGIHPWFSESYRRLPEGPAANAARDVLRSAASSAPKVSALDYYLSDGESSSLRERLSSPYYAFLDYARSNYRTSL